MPTQPASAPASAPATQSMPTNFPRADRNLVVARTQDGDFTVGDLVPAIRAQLPQNAPDYFVEQQLVQPMMTLQTHAATYLGEREIVRHARETSPTLFDRWREDLINLEGSEIIQILAQDPEFAVTEVSDEEALAYYEQNKVEFRVPLSFHMRHLSLTTYETHTVKPGETLESIARDISGSEDAVTGILTNTTGKLPRYVPKDQQHRRPFIPLREGESLLVPMSQEGRDEVRRLIEEKILPQIKQGVPLEQLAERYSDAPDKGKVLGPLPFGTTPFIPQLLDAARTLPIGEVSGIIETAHGFEIIQVTERTDERQKPFEEVREEIKEKLKQKNVQDNSANIAHKMWGRLEIDFEAIKDTKAADEMIVVSSSGGSQWTRGEIERLIGESLGSQRSPATILSAIQGNLSILSQLFIEFGHETGLYNDAFERRIDMKKDHLLARKIIDEAVAKSQKEYSDAEVAAWYEQNKSQFTPPRTFKVRQIVVKVEPGPARAQSEQAALELLREGTRRVDSEEEFLAAVRKLSQDPASRDKQGSIGQVSEGFKSGTFAEVLASLEPKTVSQPFIHGDFAYVIWIDEIHQTPAPPIQGQEDAIRQRMNLLNAKEAEGNLMRAALNRIGFSVEGIQQ